MIVIFDFIYDNPSAFPDNGRPQEERSNVLKRVLFFISLLACCSACQNTSGPAAEHALVTPSLLAQSQMPRDLLKINSLAILPPEIDERVTYPEGWPATVFEELDRAAHEQLDLQLIPSKDVRNAMSAQAPGDTMPSDRLQKLGKQVGADGVLRTRVLKYVQREGSAVGADVPAGVDFTMALSRVSDGKQVWEASYHFQDAALSENLFKVKDRLRNGMGPGWRTADDLLASGFRSAFGDFSAKRQAQFASQ